MSFQLNLACILNTCIRSSQTNSVFFFLIFYYCFDFLFRLEHMDSEVIVNFCGIIFLFSNLPIVFFCMVIRFSLINKRRDTKYVYTDLTDLER